MRRARFRCYNCLAWVFMGAVHRHTGEVCRAIQKRRERRERVSRWLDRNACKITAWLSVVFSGASTYLGYHWHAVGLLSLAILVIASEYDEQAGA